MESSVIPRMIIGISGASGAAYGIRALQMLKKLGIETHLVISKSAQLTLATESALSLKDAQALADVCHHPSDIGASIASGSFATLGMLVAPCSVKTLAEIASGVTTSLLSRAADVCLKERRRVVLMVRESPLHHGHIRNMAEATQMGAVIMPPVPAFYTQPASLEDMVDYTVGRALALFGIASGTVPEWPGLGKQS